MNVCRGFLAEARMAREAGTDNRDMVWTQNWELMWRRMDFTGKADWQSQFVMPEVPKFVDRFAAAMKRTFFQAGDWYDIEDPLDPNGDLEPILKKVIDIGFDRCALNMAGQTIGFPAVFSDAMKLGALMMCALSVTWEDGQLRISPVDARELYYDPTGRGLYRIREFDIDRHVLLARAEETDADGKPLWYKDRIEALSIGRRPRRDFEQPISKGHLEGVPPSWRKPLYLDEFLFRELLDENGNVIGENQLVVMANEQRIVRGPEPNPFWHGKDWIVASPLITVPLSVYGRSYVEDGSALVKLESDLTNLIADGTRTHVMNSYAMRTGWLENASDVEQGLVPNKIWALSEDAQEQPMQEFLQKMEMGELPPSVIQVWTAIHGQIREAFSANDINLGQIPPKGDITATEINAVGQSGSELVEDIAQGIDDRILSPLVELVWSTMLQHIDPENDPEVAKSLGEPISQAIIVQRQDFRERKFHFKAHAISGVIQRQAMAQRLLSMMSIAAQSPLLEAALLQTLSVKKIVHQLLRGVGIDIETLELDKGETNPQPPPAPPPRGRSGGSSAPSAPPGAPGAGVPMA